MSFKAFAFVGAFIAIAMLLSPVQADEKAELKKELADLKQEFSEFRADADKAYLEARRATAVRGMVQEVLEDAEARQNLAAEGATAGWNDGFYLKSADGTYVMNISGFIQARWIGNLRDRTSGGSAGNETFESGFDLAEARLRFDGTVLDPRVHYVLEIYSTNDGDIQLYEASIGFQVIDEGDHSLYVSVGQGNFIGGTGHISMEDQIHDTMQLAVDRSWQTSRFKTNFATGIYAAYAYADLFKVQAYVADNDNTDWDAGNLYEIAVRIDVKVMGSWDQYDDFSSWSGEEMALFVGGGLAFTYGTSGYPVSPASGTDWNRLSWALDARFEWNGFAFAIGIQGATAGVSTSSTITNLTEYGGIFQVSYNINDTIEPFIRVDAFIPDGELSSPDWLSDDGAISITAGFNWFIHKHDLKFTFDVIYTNDEILDGEPALGYLDDNDGADRQIIVRMQVQLKF